MIRHKLLAIDGEPVWNRFFVLIPVYITDNKIVDGNVHSTETFVWWETIERRLCKNQLTSHFPFYEYRLLENQKP